MSSVRFFLLHDKHNIRKITVFSLDKEIFFFENMVQPFFKRCTILKFTCFGIEHLQSPSLCKTLPNEKKTNFR